MKTLEIETPGGPQRLALPAIKRTGSLGEWATSVLLSALSDSRLPAGSKLPTEADLCRSLEVSRTVIREALARLKAEGILVSRRGSGIYVADTKRANLPKIGAPENLEEVLNILELRAAVEVEAAALAARRLTSSGMIELEAAMLDFANSINSWESATSADFNFHTAIARASGNPQFELFINEIRGLAIPRQSLNTRFPDEKTRTEYLQGLIDEHQEIHSAILARDPKVASSAMRKHLEGSRRRYLSWSSATGGSARPATGN